MISVKAKTYRVIVIETQALIGKALCEMISRDIDFEIVADFKTVRSAVASNYDPELVVLDIDGLEDDLTDAVRACKAIGTDAHVCALTSFAQAEVMQRCLAAGAEGFVVKDATPVEFLRAVRSVAEGISYVDPRVAGDLLRRRSLANGHIDPDELSLREVEIVCLIARGCSNREISTKLVLSEKTVKNYISRIFSKLGITARTQAAAFAFRAGMV